MLSIPSYLHIISFDHLAVQTSSASSIKFPWQFIPNMDVPFENIGVTNLVPNDVLKGEYADVINPNGFDSDLGNDNETSNYRRRRQKNTTTKEAKGRVYLHSIESRRNLKLYKNDSVRVRARCDGNVPVFTMSQGNGPTSPNQGMEAGPNGSSDPTTRSKKMKNIASIKRYILVIIDDYSRYTWTYFLRSKDETPEVLKDFLKTIQRNLQAQVNTVCTDRGTGFLNKTLQTYFKEEG
ncbi:shikimate O-hydroxycinnamoyltransferase [Tanacetum coccineum]